VCVIVIPRQMRGIFPQAFSSSAGERKLMNHFVVNTSSQET
jgi:hypothetical protein